MADYTGIEQQLIIDKLNYILKQDESVIKTTFNKAIIKYVNSDECKRINLRENNLRELLKLIFSDYNRNLTIKDLKYVNVLIDYNISDNKLKSLGENVYKNIYWCKCKYTDKHKRHIYRIDGNEMPIRYDMFRSNDNQAWDIEYVIPLKIAEDTGLTKYLKKESLELVFNRQAESIITKNIFGDDIYTSKNNTGLKCKYKRTIDTINSDDIDVMNFIQIIERRIMLRYLNL